MFVISWLGFHLKTAAVIASVLAVAFAVRRWRRVSWRTSWMTPGHEEAAGQRLTEIEWVFVFIIVACLGTRTIACWLTPLCDWDALCFWGLKSKVFYVGSLKDAGEYFHGPAYRFTNQTYPLLWPIMYTWVCTVLGRWDDLRMLALNPLNLIVFCALVYYTLRKSCAARDGIGNHGSGRLAACFAALCGMWPSGHSVDDDRRRVAVQLACLDAGRAARIDFAGGRFGGWCVIRQTRGPNSRAGQFMRGHHGHRSGSAAAGPQALVRPFGVVVAIAGLMAAPWLWYRSGIAKEAWQIGGQGFSRVRWEQLPTLLSTIVANALNFHNGVGLPKWNLLWPILIAFLVLSKSPRKYPWICLLGIFIFHGTAVICLHLASQLRLTLSAHEFALERYTLIMIPPLWVLLGICVDEWWHVWRATHAEHA